MLLFELARDHLSFGDFVAGHHLRMRMDDARRFVDSLTGPGSFTTLDMGYSKIDTLMSVPVVYDETVSENAWNLCPNGRTEAVVATGDVLGAV